jgi:hypothetical protein
MALPGPPPGPPPSASRSQSASTAHRTSSALLLPAPRPRIRKAPSLGMALDPIPPTPAGWSDNAVSTKPAPLYVDTGTSFSKSASTNAEATLANFSYSAPADPAPGSGLFRRAAQRDLLGKGLRDHGATSKSAVELSLVTPDGESTVSNNPWANHLPINYGAARSEAVGEDRFAEGREANNTETNTAILADFRSGPVRADAAAGRAKPNRESLPLKISTNNLTPTPPFSPGSRSSSPALESASRSKKQSTPYNTSQKIDSGNRTISHILHTPTDDRGFLDPVAPLQLGKSESPILTNFSTPDLEQFMTDSVTRHRIFLQNERLARDDQERLRVFSEYIIAESCIRRRRYSKAWASGGFDVRSVKDRLFDQVLQDASRSSSISESTPGLSSEPPTPASSSSAQGRHDNTWWSNYQPVLSPIASMGYEEASSRGRTSSRWWESHAGSDSVGGARKIERSKRESKYMGFQREAMYDVIPEIDPPTNPLTGTGEDGEYPVEKADPSQFGVYDDTGMTLTPRFQPPNASFQLDVSRFITLPPPYPRHFPAVNNAHPSLLSYRTAVRAYSDLNEATDRKSRCNLSTEAMRKDTLQRLAEARRRFRENIQAQIGDGSISYAEAAEAEEALKLEEHRIEKQAVQDEFDSFQDVVLNPLYDMLNGRITSITNYMKELQELLFTQGRSVNPDQIQEEGDEEPELLEKLTQMKWLFEVREQIYKELYDLLTQRNEKYKSIVLLPYQQADNVTKLENSKTFFSQDNLDRQISYHGECLKRHEDFLKVIESNVSRGVELQSSTFWDIAPGILDLLQQIPADLNDFGGIQIPEQEYLENPSYIAYPFQYLYSLLSHAEKSTYQFIEAQINLHCLVHEAKTGLVSARYKVMESQRLRDQGGQQAFTDLADSKANEEAMLTQDLRQKTVMIEEQWTEALGSQIEATREHVKMWLISENGWDDALQGEV